MTSPKVLAFDMSMGGVGVYCGWSRRCSSFANSQVGLRAFVDMLLASDLAIAFSGDSSPNGDYDRDELCKMCANVGVVIDAPQFEAKYRNVMWDIWQTEGLGCFGKSLFNASTEVFGAGILKRVVRGFSADPYTRGAQLDAYLVYRLWVARQKKLKLTLLNQPRSPRLGLTGR